MVVLVGLPGSGKTTYLRNINAIGLSSDAIRGLLADDETDQTIHDRVFQTLRYLLRHRLATGRPVTYIDATNLVPQERAPYIGIALAYGADVDAVYFDIPVERCLQQNAMRERKVPEDILYKMAEKLVLPSVEEGFSHVRFHRPPPAGPNAESRPDL